MKIGDTVAGRYQLSVSLGGGGIGEVFAARDLRSRREVALKALVNATEATERLETMASLITAATRVAHPVVVLPRIQLGLSETPPFVVGELIPGEDLSAVFARGPVPWQRAFDIVLACVEGLIALAETTGAAHCALKPGNIRTTPEGDARMLDFGIATLGVQPVRPRGDGSVIDYRAPEQITGAPGDSRSDVFALGALLFEMVTGVHPYSGPTAFAVARKILTQQSPPMPSELAPAAPLPSQVEGLIVRALSREPAGRFSDVVDLRRHLTLVRSSPGMMQRARPVRALVNEELTQPLKTSEFPDELTTAVNLPLLRSLLKTASAPTSQPKPPSMVLESAQEPATEALPRLGAETDTPRLVVASDSPQPSVESQPPPEVVRAPTKTEVPADEEKTIALPMKLSAPPQTMDRQDATLEFRPRLPHRGGPETVAAEVEVTTIIAREQTVLAPAAPLSFAPVQSAPTDVEEPARGSEHVQALPRSLVLLNLACLLLLLLGLYAVFAS